MFWISMGGFTLYNVPLGYLLVQQVRASAGNLYLFTDAMGLHFLVNDYGLREHHQAGYCQVGRWLLSAAVLTGALLGLYRGCRPNAKAASALLPSAQPAMGRYC